jgi:1-deoxy-D-xylulose-5-phosphate reductoisomerase
MEAGGLSGAVLNGAKETALEAFLDREIAFLQMADVVERTMARMDVGRASGSIEAVYAADAESRVLAREEIKKLQSAAA